MGAVCVPGKGEGAWAGALTRGCNQRRRLAPAVLLSRHAIAAACDQLTSTTGKIVQHGAGPDGWAGADAAAGLPCLLSLLHGGVSLRWLSLLCGFALWKRLCVAAASGHSCTGPRPAAVKGHISSGHARNALTGSPAPGVPGPGHNAFKAQKASGEPRRRLRPRPGMPGKGQKLSGPGRGVVACSPLSQTASAHLPRHSSAQLSSAPSLLQRSLARRSLALPVFCVPPAFLLLGSGSAAALGSTCPTCGYLAPVQVGCLKCWRRALHCSSPPASASQAPVYAPSDSFQLSAPASVNSLGLR